MSEVKIWEEDVVIPTYEPAAPDRNPMFLEKRVYQGSSGKIYPYPSVAKISHEKHDRSWHAVFLENEYLIIMVLPALGGRIQRATDKTNGYDFVYYNHVIKPALVGLTGPWISGGIEFNWPQHHRPTTYSPVDYRLIERKDGAKTVITGDVDQINGTKEMTSITLYPGKSYIEIRGQLYNGTPLPQTFLWWANPAVPVNDYTQSIFPPDVHNVYDHGKRAVSRFPIATGTYYKHDYSEGVDISRYKNIPVPTSYMAEKSDYDFVGGYDYRQHAGLLHVADHHVSTGKKQWTWGCGDFGKAWDRALTDEDGPYIELMTGMYCDNQPDFSWLKPHEEKVFTQYFMPYKEVGQVKNASIHAVLGVEKTEEGKIHVTAYATEKYEDGRIVLTYDGKEIYNEACLLSPNDVFEKELDLDAPDIYKLKTSVYAGDRELISYQAVDQGIPKVAEPAITPAAPEKVITNEELYIIGHHIEQYRHATWLPDPYYLEGLKRDSGDIRINDAYGMLLFRRGCFKEAEKYFHKALERLTALHPNPYDSAPFCHLGLSLFYQGKYDEAYDAFYKAIWTDEQGELGWYYLAVIACRRGDWDQALDFIDRSLVKNSHNVKARGLRALILSRLGREEEAGEQIENNIKLDSFDWVSRFAGILLNPADKALQESFHALSRDFHETYLQAARDFMEAGFYEEALKLLQFGGAGVSAHPMVLYYSALCALRMGDMAKADEYYAAAEKADPTYCFPNKLEDIPVLKAAMKQNPNGAKAYYYLGCLYYDKLQFDEAIGLWETSRELDEKYPTLLRNLSIAYYNKRHEAEKAQECMEAAFALDPSDARVFLERDWLYQKLGKAFDFRLKEFEKHIALIEERDDLYLEYVTLLNDMGLYEEALAAIERHDFQTWEGAEGKISTQFKVSLLELSKKDLAAGAYEKARERLEYALSYPENLGEGRLEGTKDNHLYYHLGLACEGLGDKTKAQECFEKATLGAMEPAGMMYYYDQPADMILYQARAFEKLGETGEANARYYKLLDYGEQHIRDTFVMDYFAVSMPGMTVFDADMDEKNRAHCFYLMGLGHLGLDQKEKAAEEFDRTLSIDPNHQNALLYRQEC